MAEIPTFENYMRPMLTALRKLGGSATIQELYDAVVDGMGLTEEQLTIVHDAERGNQSEVGYRMAWARTYLKKTGYLTNSERGIWALTQRGREEQVDPAKVVESVRAGYAIRRSQAEPEPTPSGPPPLPPATPELGTVEELETVELAATWRQRTAKKLATISPAAFERLCQRILRESGFVEVKVTGRSGDGGIDGIGLLRLQRVVSFQVLFQCKRWQGSVGSKEVRDFRGAMVGRSDKGLLLTTGTFSRSAQEEATRDGAPPIDLVDGEQLIDLLKDLKLGVRTVLVEQTEVDEAWFDGI
jgi:restriction system protein